MYNSYPQTSDNKSRHALIASCLDNDTEHVSIVAMIDSPLAEKPRLVTAAGACERVPSMLRGRVSTGDWVGVLSSVSLVSPFTLSNA